MRLKSAGAALAAVLLALTTGCATYPTPYQPYVPEGARGIHGGYSDQQLAPDRYIVRFHGNQFTSREQVEGGLLYRSAQLALQNGFDTFVMIDRQIDREVQTYVRPDPFYNPWYGPSYGYWHPDWRYYVPGSGWNYWHPGFGPFWRDRPDLVRVEMFEASAEIVLRKGPPPPGEPRAFDARKVIADVGPAMQTPTPR